MVLTIVSALLGASFNLVPTVLEMIKPQTDNAQRVSLAAVGEQPDTILDTVRSTIRPVITYLFFMMFMGIKITVFIAMLSQPDVQWDVIMKTVWDQDTQALFALILGFWFGSRVLEKK